MRIFLIVILLGAAGFLGCEYENKAGMEKPKQFPPEDHDHIPEGATDTNRGPIETAEDDTLTMRDKVPSETHHPNKDSPDISKEY